MQNLAFELNVKIEKMLDYFIGVLMLLLLSIIFFQVLNRFILHIPAAWTEEIGRYVFVWLSLFGSVKALKMRAHLSVDILVQNLKPSIQPFIGIIAEILTLMFCLILTKTGYSYTISNMGISCEFGQFPIFVFYAAVPLAGLLLSLVTIMQIIDEFKNIKSSSLR